MRGLFFMYCRLNQLATWLTLAAFAVPVTLGSGLHFVSAGHSVREFHRHAPAACAPGQEADGGQRGQWTSLSSADLTSAESCPICQFLAQLRPLATAPRIVAGSQLFTSSLLAEDARYVPAQPSSHQARAPPAVIL